MAQNPTTNIEAPQALSVSAALNLAKGTLESLVLTIVGEVSEVSVKAGYKAAYFTIKDAGGALSCMMWNNRFKASGINLQLGQLVQITGRFTVFAAKGRMNFDVFSISLAGEGNLRLQVANLAKKLQAEGLCDPARKKALPAYPTAIGVVTSPRGDAIHDVLRTLRRRYPLARVLVAGVPVEGANAPRAIVDGIKCVYDAGASVILVVRGGGSFEDLMPFNDERLARTIAACPTPIVTGIGHEPDTTIADMVADVRASTPTAAAEAVRPAREQLQERLRARALAMRKQVDLRVQRAHTHLDNVQSRPLFADEMYLLGSASLALDVRSEKLQRAIPYGLEKSERELEEARRRLVVAMPRAFDAATLRVSRAQELLVAAIGRTTAEREARLALASARLDDLSPLKTLSRGYAMAKTEDGSIVKSVSQVHSGGKVDVSVSDGTLHCVVDQIEPNNDSRN